MIKKNTVLMVVGILVVLMGGYVILGNRGDDVSSENRQDVPVKPFEYNYPSGFVEQNINSYGDYYQEHSVNDSIGSDFLVNIFISIEPGVIAEKLEDYAAQTIEYSRLQTVGVEVIEEGRVDIDGTEGYSFTARVTDVEGSFITKQIFYTKYDKIVYITLSSSAEVFDELKDGFDSSLASFKLN